MSVQGPLSPGTVTSDALGDSLRVNAWSDPTNAEASDNAYASSTATNDSGGAGEQKTHYLLCSNFGFTIPSGATIDGIIVEVECNTDDTSANLTARLHRNGTFYGSYQFLSPKFAEPDYSSVGSNSNVLDFNETWAEINDSNFGVAIEVSELADPGATNPNIDHVRLTVYYTEAAPAGGAPYFYRHLAGGGSM